MKKYILWLLLTLYAIAAHGQQTLLYSNGEIRDSIESTLPTCSIVNVDDGVLVTYHFSKAQLIDDQIFSGSTMWKIDGFGINDTECQPAVLRRSDAFLIPEGKTGEVILLECKYNDYSYKLSPAYPPLIDGSSEPYSKSNIPDIATYDGWFPQDIACSEAEFNYRGHRLNYVQLSPIQYNHKQQTVRAYSEISYKIVFNQDPEYVSQSMQKTITSQGSQWQDSKILSNIVRNYPVDQDSNNSGITKITPVLPGKTDIAEDYLIITTSKYSEAAEKFAEWKRHLGYKPIIVKNNNWNPTTIKAAVKSAYEGSNLMHNFLIIGNHSDVPTEILYNENIASDYKYGYIPEGDTCPYLYRGRLLVNTPNEADVVISKIINYEKNPITDSNFYKRGVNCAYFQDDEPNTKESRKFASTSEEIRDYMISQGKSVERIYYAHNNINPLYWYSGQPIPDELKKPAFKWDGNKNDIINSINQGCFYILHRAHGGPTKWVQPPFYSTDLSLLSNGNKLPVVFSINCETGKFDNTTQDCFAQKFLSMSGGCVGIFAATRETGSFRNDYLIKGMFDAIWPTPGLYQKIPNSANSKANTPVYTLGEIFEVGIARMCETYGISNPNTHYKTYHCFGDPSMQIYTDQPTSFKNVTISKGRTTTVKVSDAPSDIKIIFYDKKSGDIKAYHSSSASYTSNNPDYVTVTICAHNRIPYIDYGLNSKDIIIQNEVITTTKTYDGDKILIGSSVSDLQPHGDVEFKANNVTISGKSIIIHPKTTITGTGFKATIKY